MILFWDLLAAAAAAVLTGLGMGSGGVLVIYLTLVSGIEQRIAQGINLLFFLFAGGAALCIHTARRKLYPSVILPMVLFGIVGALLGSMLAHSLPPALLRRIFGGMLVISGILSWRRTRNPANRAPWKYTKDFFRKR